MLRYKLNLYLSITCNLLLILASFSSNISGKVVDQYNFKVEQRSRDITVITIDQQVHLDYGLAYPITYEFYLPNQGDEFSAYLKYRFGDNWIEMVEKTSNDFFNGIEAVRFGLNAVKNVGGNAVDALVEARQEVEEISDFMEFLKILDFNRMNKRMLETLVKCGAFDSFRPNRAQLFNVLDHAIHLAQEFQRAEDGSQQSLFDLMDESEARQTETQLELPDIRDWSLKERLRLEKESLGFYVSGHPLDQYASDVKALATSSADILTGIHKEGDNVSIAGIVVEKTIRLTKNSEKFAIVRLEDLRGILELPIYSRIYNDYGHLLEMDEPLLVSGRISFRDDEFGLVADCLELLSQVRSEKALSMTICIDQERMPPEQLRHLRGIFQKYQGSQKVHFRVKTESDASVMIQTPMQVQLNPRMMDELEELWKEQAALFTYAV